MYLIIGLGNPEEEYDKTRHNMGFWTINKIAKKYNINITKNKFQGLYEKCVIEDNQVVLLKPQTYMNLSGESIRQFMNFYKIPTENIIVIYDEMDIEPGKIKIRKKGGSGGHNGIKSIIENIGTQEFSRIRIGIGRPRTKEDGVNYVIGKLSKEDELQLDKGVGQAEQAVIEILKNGIDIAMNKFN